MRQRCNNPKAISFPYYGGKGIRCCERWALFANFLADMGPAPPEMELDRIDGTKNYEPGNCRWATKLVQANNQANNRRITFGGKTQTLKQWSRDLGLSYMMLRNRLRMGWSEAAALSTPPTRVWKRGYTPKDARL